MQCCFTARDGTIAERKLTTWPVLRVPNNVRHCSIVLLRRTREAVV